MTDTERDILALIEDFKDWHWCQCSECRHAGGHGINVVQTRAELYRQVEARIAAGGGGTRHSDVSPRVRP